MKKKIFGLLMAAVMCASVFTGCGTSKEEKPEEKAEVNAAKEKEESKEEKQLVLGSVRDMIPGEGDCFYVNLTAHVWEPLVLNKNHVLEPCLAESWEYNEDCTEWTFHLVQNAEFTDGVKFNADVCLQNIERYKKGPLTSTYTSLSIDKSFR